MPRPINFALLDLFDYNDIKKIMCFHGSCKGRVLFRHGGNLQRHLKSLHPQIYLSYLENKDSLQEQGGFCMQKKLIDLVRDKPFLWDGSSNQNLYSESWEEISQQLNLHVEICKQKWRNLRNYFRNEIQKSTATDPESDQGLTSNWKLFSNLMFLKDVVLSRERSENIKREEEIESLLYSINEQSNQSNVSQMELIFKTEEDECLENIIVNNTCVHESQKRSTYIDNDNLNVQPEVKKMKTEIEIDYDEEKMFLLSLLPYLKTIPENRRLLVRHKIQGVLLEDEEHGSVLMQ